MMASGFTFGTGTLKSSDLRNNTRAGSFGE
jgi:hypothetical protein